MSSAKFYSYPGKGELNHKMYGYNQAVRVGDRIEIAGQGGWNTETGVYYKDIDAQIDQAFVNVDVALKHAGGKGWSQVFRVNSYHLPLNNEALAIMGRNFKKWMPDHEPIWTVVGVARLGDDEMRIEMEVVALDPEGAKAEAAKDEAAKAEAAKAEAAN